MIKRILALILVICLMLVPGGCRLAVPDGEMQEGSDRLIGMLITKDHYSASENGEERVYARLSYEEAENDEGEPLKFKTYVFDGIDGWYILCPTFEDEDGETYSEMCGSEGIDESGVSLICGDNANSIKVSGTLRAVSGSGESTLTFIGNPVYQSADGSVYALMNGTGMSFGDSSAADGALSLSESETSEDMTQKSERNSEVVVNIKLVDPTEKVRVYEMDENGACLLQNEYTGETIPDEYSPCKSAEFIVIEELLRGGGHSYFAYGRSDESFVSYFAAGDEICTGFTTTINWQ